MAPEWASWGGTVRCTPRRIESPASEDALANAIRRARDDGMRVRVFGTGHSSMPLVATDDVLVSLDALAGMMSADPARRRAWVWAGTRLTALGGPLRDRGLAMENLGDVDVQSLGGALGTGTHGTGHTMGNLSSRVGALRLVDAQGQIRECARDRDPDPFQAARVSIGSLGIFSRAELDLLPAYRLHERVWRSDIDVCLGELDRHIRENRHFEFFWFPQAGFAEMKTLNPTRAEPDPLPDVKGERIGWSADIIPSVREIKFHEMEYAVPAEDGPTCFARVRERLRERHPDVAWPVEYRTVAADDAWLSPAYGRATVTISVHEDVRRDYRAAFHDVEPIFWEHGGRPHWGKLHQLRAPELAKLYPMWDRFCSLRRSIDPHGLFSNDHLRELFG